MLNESPPKATRDQIRQVVVDRYGIRLDNRQFERLKEKYITRPGKPATHYELAVQIREGRQSIPSEFILTGLLNLLMPLGAPVERLEQSPGA